MARRVFEVIGRPDMTQDERFATNASRVGHRAILVPMIEQTMRTRSTT